MIQKPRHRPRCVQRQKLVHCAGRGITGKSLRRRPCRRGDQKPKIGPRLPHRGDQPAQGHHLAQADGMHPDQAASRAGQTGLTQLFTPTQRVFFAAHHPAPQISRQKRRNPAYCQQIGPQQRPRRRHQGTHVSQYRETLFAGFVPRMRGLSAPPQTDLPRVQRQSHHDADRSYPIRAPKTPRLRRCQRQHKP